MAHFVAFSVNRGLSLGFWITADDDVDWHTPKDKSFSSLSKQNK